MASTFCTLIVGGVIGAFLGYVFQLGTVESTRGHYEKIIKQMEQNVNVVIHKVPFCPCNQPAQQKLNHDGKEHYLCNECVPEFLSKIGEAS